MGTTRLERKARRNKSRAKNRVKQIKRLNALPTIKNVDVEEIKKSFESPAKEKKAEKKAEAAKVEEAAPAKEKKAEKKEEAPKAEAKKEAKAEKKEEKPAKEEKKAPKAKKEDKESK